MKSAPVALIIALVFGQSECTKPIGDSSKFAKSVDSFLRAPFRDILNKELVAQKKEDSTALYDLQLPAAIERESRERYLSSRREESWALKDFVVTRIDVETMPKSPNGSGSWTVLGCALIRDKEKRDDGAGARRIYESALRIFLDKGRWYASTVELVIPKDENLRKPSCQLSDGINPQDLWSGNGGL